MRIFPRDATPDPGHPRVCFGCGSTTTSTSACPSVIFISPSVSASRAWVFEFPETLFFPATASAEEACDDWEKAAPSKKALMAGRSFVANKSTSVRGISSCATDIIFRAFRREERLAGTLIRRLCVTFRSPIDNHVNSAEIIKPAFSSSFPSCQFPTWSSFEIIFLALPNGI